MDSNFAIGARPTLVPTTAIAATFNSRHNKSTPAKDAKPNSKLDALMGGCLHCRSCASAVCVAAWVLYITAMSTPSLGAEGMLFETFQNADGLVEVLYLNDRQSLILRREVARTNVREMRTFVRLGDDEFPLNVPDGFTNVEALGINQRDQIVGYATRPIGNRNGNQRAVVWSPHEASVLPVPEGYRGGVGHDISGDGLRVTGIVLGRDPPRIIPCIWEWMDQNWTWRQLPSDFEFNRLLTTAHVVISDNGEIIAASVETGPSRYGLYYWREDKQGNWQPKLMLERAVHLANISDSGLAVGRVLMGRHRRAFVFSPEDGARIIPLPIGHVSSRATGVNAKGQVVGYSEERPGPQGTMTAFLWHNGRLRPLSFPQETAMSTANWVTNDGRIGGLVQYGEEQVLGYTLSPKP